MTQKNKIFSIILSLLVLSSVACRKSGGGNGGGVVTEPDALPGTFSITEASGNVKALVVKPDTTVSDIKIAFSSSADYTAEFTVEDSETVEANKITSEDFEFANNSLTAKTTLVDKVRKLDSSSKTVDKTIKINRIKQIYIKDMKKLENLESNAVYRIMPATMRQIVFTKKEIEEESGVSRNTVLTLIDKLVKLNILVPDSNYAKLSYRYNEIYNVFVGKDIS